MPSNVLGQSEFTFNFHEEALVSGLVIAERLGAGYLYNKNPLAEEVFIRIRGLDALWPESSTAEASALRRQLM